MTVVRLPGRSASVLKCMPPNQVARVYCTSKTYAPHPCDIHPVAPTLTRSLQEKMNFHENLLRMGICNSKRKYNRNMSYDSTMVYVLYIASTRGIHLKCNAQTHYHIIRHH